MKAFQPLNKSESDSTFLEKIVHVVTIVSTFLPFFFLCFGAYLQVSELFAIDVYFIRFFSASQLFSDSLAFLSLFIFQITKPILLGFAPYYFFFKVLNITEYFWKFCLRLIDTYQRFFLFKKLRKIIIPILYRKKGKISSISHYEDMIYFLYINFIFKCLVLYVFNNAVLELFELDGTKNFLVYTFQIICLTYELNVAAWETKFIQKMFQRMWKNLLDSILVIFNITTFFLLLVMLFLLLQKLTRPIISKIINSLYSNERLLNFESLNTKYKKKNLKSKVLYFNDKFIFLGIEKDTVVNYPVGKVDSTFHHLQKIKINLPTDFKVKILPFEEIFEDGKKD